MPSSKSWHDRFDGYESADDIFVEVGDWSAADGHTVSQVYRFFYRSPKRKATGFRGLAPRIERPKQDVGTFAGKRKPQQADNTTTDSQSTASSSWP